MPASEAQIRANRENARKSTGPKTPEGKAKSRANSYKHGLTGSGIVLLEKEVEEVHRRHLALCEELNPAGEIGMSLVFRLTVLSVRTERCVDQEYASMADQILRLEREFVPPEGVDEAEEERLRHEAGRRALFEPSKETTLVRRYEATAERYFYRALQELRQHQRTVEAAGQERGRRRLASILPGEMSDEELDEICVENASMRPLDPLPNRQPVDLPAPKGGFDVPFTIGKPA